MIINPNSITTEGDRILHTGNTHANLHAEDGSDPITPASIGAETPAGAQAKVDTHEAKAAPHSGHETPAGAQSKVDTHENKKTTHGLGSGYYLAKTSRSDQLPAWGDIQGKPSTFSPSSHSHPWSEVTEKPSSYTPSSHNNSHASGGSDPITPASIGAETPAGAQAKADAAESAAKSYTDTHENKTSTHGATATPTANRIAMYDSGKRLSSGAAPTSDNHVVRKIDMEAAKKHSLIYLGESIDYGGTIYAIAVDDDYVYIGGWITQKVYKLNKSNLSKVTESNSYGGTINAIAVDNDFVYVGGESTNKVYKLNKTDLSKVAESNYGGTIYAIAVDDDFVYAGGASTNKVYKLNKSDLSKVTESAGYGGTINPIAVDDDYVYARGAATNKIYKLLNLVSLKN